MSDEKVYKYAYEKLMAEHELKLSDLPEDARIGIATIKKIETIITTAESKGKKASKDTLAKVKANDKWVVNEILDFVDEKDENDDKIPHDADEIKEDLNDNEGNQGDDTGADDNAGDDNNAGDNSEANKELGIKIEAELDEMFKTGKVKWSADEIKVRAKNTYNTLFEHYKDGEENGVETTNYKLLETGEEIYTLSKK